MAEFKVAFWNVSNLFEPKVLPRGPQSWGELHAKLDVLASAINRFFANNQGPDLLGLAEISTDVILKKLIKRLSGSFIYHWTPPNMSFFQTKIRHTGIALIARTSVVSSIKYLTEEPRTSERPTCIIYEVSLNGVREPILVSVVHWKSRMGGDQTVARRKVSAKWLGDYLAQSSKNTCVIVMGDFNAEPFESVFSELSLRSIRFFSTALWTRATPAYLYNCAWRHLPEPDYWEDKSIPHYKESRPKTSHDCSPAVIFDQLLVSGQALRNGPVILQERSVKYYCEPPVGRINSAGVRRPNRWVWSQRSGAGVSDHFPLCAIFDY